MNEKDDAALTPAEAEVAKLLAEAGGPVAMPPDVEARLRAVLDELATERTPDDTSDVTPLATRRRWPRVLLAAAAVLVGGYGVGTLAVQGTLSGSEDAMSAADSAGAGSAEALADRESDQDSGALDSGPDEQGLGPEKKRDGRVHVSGSTAGYLADGLVRIRSDRLDVGVQRALRVLDRTEKLAELDAADRGESRTCGPPGVDLEDESLQVRYDRQPAVLVVEELGAGLVEVTVYSCNGVELDDTVVEDVPR